jgi:tryptophan synthase alpha chain
MENKITASLSQPASKKIRLMTHVVAGYPNMSATEDIMKTMADEGVDLIEIQIPFSDPMADGPTIMKANQQALDNGTTLSHCFSLAEKMSAVLNIPLLFMSYINVPYRAGINTFIAKAKNSGISGLIVPDIPYDEDNIAYNETCLKEGLTPVQVISPDINRERLIYIAQRAHGFIYTTLKVGITGARKEIDNNGLSFISKIKKHTDVPVAAGFGISEPAQVENLSSTCDIAVIGSHLINVYENSGLKGIKKFLTACRKI